IVLLSHAHFDHFDMRTLHRFHRSTRVITAHRTTDLLRWTRFRDVSELRWKERKSVSTSAGKIDITAFRVKHWGARKQRDTYRGYNGAFAQAGRAAGNGHATARRSHGSTYAPRPTG